MALRIHTVFWVKTPYSLHVAYKNFAETHYLLFQCDCTMNVEAV